MSRLAFISDIHGNFPALQAVISDIESCSINNIYCLGDLVGYYSQINEVINLIKEKRIPCIMGNHDFALTHNSGFIERSRTCTNVLTKQIEYITEDNFTYLNSLPSELLLHTEFGQILCVHGGLNNHIDEYLKELNDAYFKGLDDSVKFVITAHNHCPQISHFKQVIYANSGSIGQPRDHDPRACWLMFDDGVFEIKRVHYNIDDTRKSMRDYGFDDYISDVLYKGFRIGEK